MKQKLILQRPIGCRLTSSVLLLSRKLIEFPQVVSHRRREDLIPDQFVVLGEDLNFDQWIHLLLFSVLSEQKRKKTLLFFFFCAQKREKNIPETFMNSTDATEQGPTVHHGMPPVIQVDNVQYYKENPILRFILERSSTDINAITREAYRDGSGITLEDVYHFRMLLGTSVGAMNDAIDSAVDFSGYNGWGYKH